VTEGVHDDQFSSNSSQVRDERRLAVQHIFIGRLHLSGIDIRSADETSEVMRDILRELYCARKSVASQGRGPQRRSGRAAVHQNGREQALAANSSQSRIMVAHGSARSSARRRHSFAISTRPSVTG
jgi:hypothetical protein